MKKIFLLFLITGFIFPLLMDGQAPGYLGKKAVVSLNFSAFPAFFSPTKNNRGFYEDETGEASNKIGLNYELDLGFEYAIGRYRSLGLSLGQYTTGVAMNDVEIQSAEFDLWLKANVRSVGIILSRYKKGKAALAPVGNRFYWGFKRDFVNTSIKQERRTSAGSGSANLDFDQKARLNFLILGWSNNQIFWDKVFFKTGFHMGIPLKRGLWQDLFNENVSTSDYDGDNQEFYDFSVYTRLLLHEFIRFDIGVGYLLF